MNLRVNLDLPSTPGISKLRNAVRAMEFAGWNAYLYYHLHRSVSRNFQFFNTLLD